MKKRFDLFFSFLSLALSPSKSSNSWVHEIEIFKFISFDDSDWYLYKNDLFISWVVWTLNYNEISLFGWCACAYTWAFLARPGSARWPGPPTKLTGREWAEILKPAKKILVRARPEMLFLVILHYKIRGRPAQARALPENWGPICPMGRSWAGFSRPEKPGFFWAQPEPGPTREMLRSTCAPIVLLEPSQT
jgi:hypothetical protein